MARLIALALVVALILGAGFLAARTLTRARRSREAVGSPRTLSSGAGPAPRGRGGRRISLLTEAVSYVGAILIFAGGIAAIGQRWPAISDWGRVTVFVGFAAFFLIVGLIVRDVAEPAAQRLADVVWLLSVVAAAGGIGFAAHQVYGASGEITTLAIGLGASAYAAVLWLVRRRALQNAALFAALVVTIAGVIVLTAAGAATALGFALGLWAFGLLWAGLGWRGYVPPTWTAVTLGVALALIGPSAAVTQYGWLYVIGIATATAAMAVSVPTRNVWLLAVGTVATFSYVTSLVVRYFGGSLGVPSALVITGVLVLALAAVSTRLMRMARPDRRRREGAGPEEAGTGQDREQEQEKRPGPERSDHHLPMAS